MEQHLLLLGNPLLLLSALATFSFTFFEQNIISPKFPHKSIKRLKSMWMFMRLVL